MLREHYRAEFNARFQVAAAEPGSAFVPCRRRDLDLVFALQFERTVNRDNSVRFQDLTLQIERQSWRGTLAGCNVTVHQHLDGAISLTSVLVWRCGISCMESKTNKHVWRGADDGD